MPIQTTYSRARNEFARLWDRVEEDREVVIITRRGHRDLALIDAAELERIQATAHLLRSPANALRLLTALQGSLEGRGTPFDAGELRRELGLAEEG